MFTKSCYEHCNVYDNPDEDIEILQWTTDWLSVDIYISGQHVYECITLSQAINYLHEVGVEFKLT